jgi:hypothetical protein
MPQNSKALVAKYQQIWDAAEAEDRDLTASERERVERIVDQAQAQHELEQKLKALGLGGEFAAPTDPNVSFTNGGGPGDAFIHGEFFGGGPFGAAHGGNSPGMFGASIWNLPVVLSNTVGAGTAVVGNFRESAHIWRRGGPSVEASNSHSDWFARDITALRCETRLALGCFRPVAFTVVSGLA